MRYYFILEIACALNYLHSRKIAYRDLKTTTLCLTRLAYSFGRFGLALFVDDEGYVDNPSSSGTAEYLAPEITRGFKELMAFKSALGVVVYEMLYAKLPLEKDQQQQNKIFMNINLN